ncbi:hypothetical protein PR202_gb06696 [Eleusine coracana subsp. coracana]|uniref:Peroxidase n=1 Tax=Eleusine coracana subsp. coracana TaxID=191504 RepID=A0AAV5EAM2_ELECO|nr:hypothetical protein PR202_gb06696 [Eleusine coracana subsp. coracana]
MAASILRLHFHDCFVQGCDGSILLDDVDGTFTGEKTADMNINSVRGFELGGPSWEVKLGRRDSTTASLKEANTDLSSPSSNLAKLIAAFRKKGFSPRELVALSGAHTIGQARCANFRERAYNATTNIDPAYGETLQSRCPRTGGDDNLTPLDVTSPDRFDGSYFRGLFRQKGLLHSDQALFDGGVHGRVQSYRKILVTEARLVPLRGAGPRKAKPPLRSEPKRVNDKKARSPYLGPSTVTEALLDTWAAEPKRWFERSCALAPKDDETIPQPHPGTIVVFEQFFEAGLRFPCSPFVGDVLAFYGLEIQQVANTIAGCLL